MASSFNSRNDNIFGFPVQDGGYRCRGDGSGTRMTLTQLRKYREVVFPAPLAQAPSSYDSNSNSNSTHTNTHNQGHRIRTSIDGVPFLSLDCHSEWITEGAVRLFKELYAYHDDGKDVDWKASMLERQKRREREREREGKWWYATKPVGSGGECEWKNKYAGKDLVLVMAYRDFILPEATTFHPFFSINNAANWVKEAPIELFEEYRTYGRLDLWNTDPPVKDEVFVFHPPLGHEDIVSSRAWDKKYW